MPVWILVMAGLLTQDGLPEARTYFAQGSFEKAADTLDRMLAANPDSGEAPYLTLIECRIKLNQREKALDAAEEGLKRYPSSGALMKAAGLLMLKDDPGSQRAGELLAGAATALPQDLDTHYSYGVWALLGHRNEIAVAEEAKALALSPAEDLTRVRILTFVGLAEDGLQHPDRAEAAFRNALAINRKLPNRNASSEYEFAIFLARQSRQDEAEALVEEILHFAPDYGPAHFERAKYLSGRGDLHGALAEGNKALSQAGEDMQTLHALHAFLAKTYFALGRSEEAEAHRAWIEAH